MPPNYASPFEGQYVNQNTGIPNTGPIPQYQAGNGNPYNPQPFNPFPTYGSGAFQSYSQAMAAPAPSSGVAVSSSPFRSQIADLGSQLSSLYSQFDQSGELADLRSSYQGMNDLLTGRQAALAGRRASAEADIERSFGTRRTQLQDTQRRETGTKSVALARMGGYLGESASGMGAMQNLEDTHQQELSYLEGLKQTALNQARQAYEDQDFALTKELMQNVRDLNGEINTRRRNFFSDALSLLGEQRSQNAELRAQAGEQRDVAQEGRAQRSFEQDLEDKRRSNAADQLERLAILDPDSPELQGMDIAGIERNLNVPSGFVKKYLKVQQDSRAKDASDDAFDRQQKEVNVIKGVYDILNEVPLGQSITIAGKTYKGLKRPPTTGAGDATKKLRIDYVGRLPDMFNQVKGSDGFISHEDYQAAMQNYIRQGYGTRKDFMEEMPPEVYLSDNPYPVQITDAQGRTTWQMVPSSYQQVVGKRKPRE